MQLFWISSRFAQVSIPVFLLMVSAVSPGGEATRTLRCGWYPWDPYQYEIVVNQERELTGLDVKLTRAIFRKAGYRVAYDPVGWQQHQMDIRDGTRDIACGAFRTDAREQYAYYSNSYRKESNVLIVPRGKAGRYDFDSIPEMLDLFRQTGFVLGAVKGYAYADPRINAYIADPANADRILLAPNEKENYVNLLMEKTNGFLVDRIVGATVAWRNGWLSEVEEHPGFYAESDIYVIFSKKSTTPELVNDYNQALAKLRQSGEYDKIVQQYVFPVLLGITVEQSWFFAIDILGTVAFAISGILLARKEKYSIFGAFILGALPAMGGGLMRDLLVARNPAGMLRTPVYILSVVCTVAVGRLILSLLSSGSGDLEATFEARSTTVRRRMALERYFTNGVKVADALGLAAFTIIGVVVAVESRCSPLWLWGPLLAVLTGAGGGILRDIVRSDSNIPPLKGSLYAEVALLWGFLLSLFLMSQTTRLNPTEIELAVLVTLVGAFLTRLAIIRFGWKSPRY